MASMKPVQAWEEEWEWANASFGGKTFITLKQVLIAVLISLLVITPFLIIFYLISLID